MMGALDVGNPTLAMRTAGFPSDLLSVGCLGVILESRGKMTTLAGQGLSEVAAWHAPPASEASIELIKHTGS